MRNYIPDCVNRNHTLNKLPFLQLLLSSLRQDNRVSCENIDGKKQIFNFTLNRLQFLLFCSAVQICYFTRILIEIMKEM